MAAPPIGLDITASSLAAVTLKRRGKAYSIVQRAEASLPSGLVTDGEVQDVEALGAAIKAFWAEHEISGNSVAIGVANQRCITRSIELPRIKKKKQLREALSFEVADNLPIPIEDAVWDFHTVARSKDESTGAEVERHIVVMAYRESVERYRDAVEAAGLKLVRIDLSAFALMRAGLPAVRLAAIAEGSANAADEQIVALLDVGASSTNVVIARGGNCELNRIVAFGRQHYFQTIVEQYGWSPEDAERAGTSAGVMPLGGVETPGDEYADTRRIMQYVADQFAQEIRTSFDYYTHSSGGTHRVERVVLAGEGSMLRGLDQRMSAELGIPVNVLDASPRLDPGSVEQLGVLQPRFGTAIGLGIEEAA